MGMKSGAHMPSRVFRHSTSLFPFFCFALAVLALLRALSQATWSGVPWFDHVDHWQSLLHAKDWSDLNQSGFPRMVFARIPGWFPDLVLARASLLIAGGYGALSMVGVVGLQFFAYLFLASLCLSRSASLSFARSWSTISLILALVLSCVPYLGLAFVPMHHGGNVIAVLIVLLALLFWLKEGVWWSAVSLIVISFFGVASNRFFVFSGLIPLAVVLLLRFRLASGLLALLCFEAGRRGWLFVPSLKQGRDVLPGLDLSLFAGALQLRLLSPILLVVGAVFLACWVFLIWRSEKDSDGAVFSFAKHEFRMLLIFSSVSFLASVAAEILVTGLGSGYLNLRYLFGPLFLVQVVAGASLAPLGHFVGVRSVGWGKSLVALLGAFLLVVFLGPSLQGEFFGSSVVASRSGSVIDLLERESLPSRYGLATYPYWQAGALEGLSSGSFDVVEASSDGTPLFWHRWKGSLFEGRELKPFSFVLVSPEFQDRVVGHYGEPGRKVFCEREGFECLWVYPDNRRMMSDIQLFIDTYGDEVKS